MPNLPGQKFNAEPTVYDLTYFIQHDINFQKQISEQIMRDSCSNYANFILISLYYLKPRS